MAKLGTDAILYGVIGSRPAAGKAGRIYFSTEPATYRDNGSSWDDVSDAGGAGTGTLAKYKTADEVVNNSSAMQNDNHLVLPLGASEAWAWALHLWYDSGITPDLKIGWAVPAGATMRWQFIGATAAGANEFGTTGVLNESSTQDLWGTGVGTIKHAEAHGTIIVAGTPGDLQLQWAQNTANASDSTVRKHSSLVAWLAS